MYTYNLHVAFITGKFGGAAVAKQCLQLVLPVVTIV